MAASLRSPNIFFLGSSKYQSVKRIHAGCYLQNSLKKSKTMQKMLGKANGKRDTKWYAPVYSKISPSDAGGHSRPVISRQRYSDGMLRRADYVSDVLYAAICQIIGSGELRVNATIIKVKVLPDMSHMNIYWEASGLKDKDEQTQISLNTIAKSLRHYLMQAHTLGNVPRPVFVRDIAASRQREVEEILKTLDLEPSSGETDKEPEHSDTEYDVICSVEIDGDVEDKSSTHIQINEKLAKQSSTHVQKNKSLDNESSTHVQTSSTIHLQVDEHFGSETSTLLRNDEGIASESVMHLRQDLYGLQHDVLMQKVVTAKQSAVQRPVITPDSESHSQNIGSRFDSKVITKLFKPHKLPSKKKLLRQMERLEELDCERVDLERYISTREREILDDSYDLDEDFSAIDKYIESNSNSGEYK